MKTPPRHRLAIALFTVAAFGARAPAAPAAPQPQAARKGMVVSTSELASRAGVEVMQRGGNAVDAAVAVGFALAVTWPSAGNLGGGGFLLLRRATGESEVIDYRERAPLGAGRDMYLDGKGAVLPGASTVGHRAVAVPGTVAGFALAHQRHGRLKWREVLEPARRLATTGFLLNRQTVVSLRANAELLAKFPESKRIYLRDGKPFEVGDRLVQPQLAAVLARLQREGPSDFYRGETARLLAAEMKRGGGLVTMQDLAAYEATIRKPLAASYRGYDILTMPPPSSGGAILIHILHLLERFPLAKLGHNSAAALHLIVEAERRAFADRAAHLGDTDFVKDVPIAGLMSMKYADERAATIDPARATPSEIIKSGAPARFERPETTHFTIVDGDGNVVSNTYTLNGAYGAGVTVAGAGFLLNNEMDDFTSKPGVQNQFGLLQGEANAIAPQKRPLSAMTPTLVLKDGKLLLALGSPGGPTIISTVLQILLNTIDFGMNLAEAVAAPRIHHQWVPDRIAWEPYGLSADTRAALEQRGHRFAEAPRYMGDAQVIRIEPQDELREGACDPRQGGVPVGY